MRSVFEGFDSMQELDIVEAYIMVECQDRQRRVWQRVRNLKVRHLSSVD